MGQEDAAAAAAAAAALHQMSDWLLRRERSHPLQHMVAGRRGLVVPRPPRAPGVSLHCRASTKASVTWYNQSAERERDREGGVKERGRDKDSGERESGSEGEERETERQRVDPRPAAEGQWLDHPGPSADLDPLTSQRCGCPTNNSAPYVNSETHHTLHPPPPIGKKETNRVLH